MIRTWCVSVLLSVAVLAGCGADSQSDDDFAPIADGSDDITAASKLVGDYDKGAGRFVSLSLTQIVEAGKTKNVFVGQVQVQCVRAPCPTHALKGKWFARNKTVTFYPEKAAAETYVASLADGKLTLKDSKGVAIAELTKKLPLVAGVAEALKKHGVEKLETTIDAPEVDAQGKGATTPFAKAVDTAIDLFLSDESGISGYASEIDASDLSDLGCKGKTGRELSKCVTNANGATMRLMKRSDSGPPEDGSVSADWVFEFSDGATDYGYYAIIPKKGSEKPYIYNFN